MNTTTTKVTSGIILASLIGTAFALTPLYSQIAEAKVAKASVNVSCMQTAVGAREDALIDAFDAFNEDVSSALTARKTALNTAWGITDKAERQTAIKKAWTDWKSAKKSAHTELKNERKEAWATFKTTAKTSCKEVVPKEEALEKDASGAIAL